VTATGDPQAEARTPAPEPGLAALYDAMTRTAERLDLDALALAIEDRRLGRQCFAAGADARRALTTLAADGAGDWTALPALHDAPVELDALHALARAAVRLAVTDPGDEPLTAVEIAVRALPAVRLVCRTAAVLEVDVEPGSRDAVLCALAAVSPSGPAAIVLRDADDDEAAQAQPPARAELVAVRSLPETGELEVHLRQGERRTVGRGPLGRAGAAAAAATIDALAALDPDTADARALRVAWVRTIDTTPERQFLVAVTLRRDQGGVLYGLAAGASPIEAAARATLHACNRLMTRAPG
jgi:hypothetical protein